MHPEIIPKLLVLAIRSHDGQYSVSTAQNLNKTGFKTWKIKSATK